MPSTYTSTEYICENPWRSTTFAQCDGKANSLPTQCLDRIQGLAGSLAHLVHILCIERTPL